MNAIGPTCPRFRSDVAVTLLESDGVVLSWTGRDVGLSGDCYRSLVPLIDGQHTPAQIAAAIGPRHSPELVFHALRRLHDLGCLADSQVPEPQGDHERARGLSVAATETVAVAVASVGAAGGCDLPAALRARGLEVADGGSPLVVLTDDYLRPEVGELYRRCRTAGVPMLPARTAGLDVWVGPLLVLDEPLCWECLAGRLRTNRPVQGFVEARLPAGHAPVVPAVARTQATANVAAEYVAGHVARYARTGGADLRHTLHTLDLGEWSTSRHHVVALPECRACGCGEPSSPAGRPVLLRPAPVAFDLDGGHRTVTPEQTLDRFERLVSPLTGVVTSLVRTGPPSPAFHVYASTQNLEPPRDVEELRRALGGGKSGKGASDVQARTSALCESLERYSGSFRGDEPRVLGRYADLAADDVVHPNDLMLFSERQYAERERWNRRETRYNFVPRRFDPTAEISWTPVWSLSSEAFRLIPTALCYYGFADAGGPNFAISCSNGCAAGNTVEEAILQGFLELVERDSIALWWYHRVSRPLVDLDSFGLPYLDRARAFLAERHRDLWVLDLTADLGIPVFAAFSRRLDSTPERILLGFGAHLDPRIALLRSVTELHQMLSWVGAMEENPERVLADSETTQWLLGARLADNPYLVGDPGRSPRTAADIANLSSGELDKDLSLCRRLVEERGMQMMVLDQTRRDVGLAVVKVFVPGLRHFWARFGPGRLYDVPVRLGWMSTPTAEADLNPTPMFI
nr:TOMM precursor leader peptide-binding protein [Actinopolymorpha rutila]